jgi:hypothetical protein
VPLGHREQFVAGKAASFGLTDDADGGLGVGLWAAVATASRSGSAPQ